MGQWLNYHHLYYFKTVAEEGGVTSAAKKLRLGQPTLSAQLKQFEQTLGVSLFQRSGRKLDLTEQGKMALQYAKQIFQLGSEMMEVLHDRLPDQRVQLTIGTIDSTPKHVMMLLAKRAQSLADCELRFVEGHHESLLEELVSHRVDLVITSHPPQGALARSVEYQLLAREPVSVWGAPQFRKLKKQFPKSLESAKWVASLEDSRLRRDVDHWVKEQGLSIQVIAETQDISLKKLLAQEGFGLMAASEFAVRQMLRRGQLVELGVLRGVFDELYVLSAKRRYANPVAMRLLRSLKL